MFEAIAVVALIVGSVALVRNMEFAEPERPECPRCGDVRVRHEGMGAGVYRCQRCQK